VPGATVAAFGDQIRGAEVLASGASPIRFNPHDQYAVNHYLRIELLTNQVYGSHYGAERSHRRKVLPMLFGARFMPIFGLFATRVTGPVAVPATPCWPAPTVGP
jgi:hypothetical protein